MKTYFVLLLICISPLAAIADDLSDEAKVSLLIFIVGALVVPQVIYPFSLLLAGILLLKTLKYGFLKDKFYSSANL